MYMSSCSNPCQSDITAFTIGYSSKFKSRHERSYKKPCSKWKYAKLNKINKNRTKQPKQT